jgi:hypothetical protein
MKTHLNVLKALLPFMVVAALLLGLVACKPQEIPLSFETLEQESSPGSIRQWEGKEPNLLIVASAQEIEEARPFVTAEVLAALQQMDYTTHFAILAFRGWRASAPVLFKIERVLRQGNEIVLSAQAGTEGPNSAESSPYHLIEVKKEGNWNADFTFSLYFNQESRAVTSATHHIP